MRTPSYAKQLLLQSSPFAESASPVHLVEPIPRTLIAVVVLAIAFRMAFAFALVSFAISLHVSLSPFQVAGEP